MSLAAIIDSGISGLPSERQTEGDHRTKAFLLYHEPNFEDRLDILLVPFGDDLPSKHVVMTYLRFQGRQRVQALSFSDRQISFAGKAKARYMRIEPNEDEKKLIIPFSANGEFPYQIMENNVAHKIATHNQNLLELIIGTIETMYDVEQEKTSKSKERKKITDVLSTTNKMLACMRGEDLVDLRTEFENAFGLLSYKSSGSKLARWQREWEDLSAESTESRANRLTRTSKPFGISTMITGLVSQAYRYPFYSTNEITSRFAGQSETNIKKIAKLFSFVRAQSPKAYEYMKNDSGRSVKIGRKLYYAGLLGMAGTAWACDYSLFAAVAGVWTAAEIIQAKINMKLVGAPTANIGTIRDLLGLTPKIRDPLAQVSENYDLGIWRPDDLNGNSYLGN